MHAPQSKFFNSEDEYVNYLASLIPERSQKVNFYGNGFTGTIRTKLVRQVREGRNRVEFFSTNEIHDRFLIKDKRYGKMIGASFGGIGHKLFLILEIPPNDVRDICVELRRIRNSQGSFNRVARSPSP